MTWQTYTLYGISSQLLITNFGEGIVNKTSIISKDKSITAFSLANSLKIPTESLPCIVITKDFRLKEFIWCRTHQDYLKEQLEKLGYIAARHGYKQNTTVLFELIEKEINLYQGIGIEVLSQNLARTLTELLDFILIGKFNYRKDIKWRKNRERIISQAKRTLSNSYKTLSKLKENLDENRIEEIDRLAVNILTFLSQLNKRETYNLKDFISVNPTLIENDSYQILKTAYKVYDLLVSEQNEYAQAILTENYDYAPTVICLAKVFEKETNLSIVHWIRQELGVLLPEYYNKPQPSVQAKYLPRHIPNPQEMD